MQVSKILLLCLILIIVISSISAAKKKGNKGKKERKAKFLAGQPAAKPKTKGKVTTYDGGIEGSYIIKYKGRGAWKKFKKQLKGKNGRRLRKLKRSRMFTIDKLSKRELDRLASNDDVVRIEQDQVVIPAYHCEYYSDVPSWGLDRLDQTSTNYDKEMTTERTLVSSQTQDVVVYVIDTGIDENHPDFSGRVVKAYFEPSLLEEGVDPWKDVHGHGTHIAGTIGGARYGVAKSVKLYSVKTQDYTGSGFKSDLIAGMDWAISDHIARRAQNSNAKSVINISMRASRSELINEVTAFAVTKGIHTVVSAGNDNANAAEYSPGSTPQAITVGASDRNDVLASYSNFGPSVDIIAPGHEIKSNYPTEYCPDFDLSDPCNNTILWSGTSMATAHVSGVIAKYLSARTFNPSPAAVIVSLKLNALKNKVTIPATKPDTTGDLLRLHRC